MAIGKVPPGGPAAGDAEEVMKNPEAADYVVGVIGAGAMGQGIIQVSVQGGMRCMILDAKPGAAEAARQTIVGRIERLVEKGRLTVDEAEAAIGRMEVIDEFAGLAPCDTVVEAIVEDIEVKREVFGRIEAAVSPDCLIASNTSSIPIASIARACQHRGRIAGLHFFNPVPLMKLVEVIRAAETTDATIEALTGLGKRMGRTPVAVKDSPGFLVNMGGRAYTTEGLRIAHEGVATPAQIDAIMRDCWHFRMGPFELMDLTGIDVNFPVSRIIYDGYMQDARIKTSPNHMAMFDAGLYGRKVGKGWYAYEGGKPLERPSPDFKSDAAPARQVALASDDYQLDFDAKDDPQDVADAIRGIEELRTFCGEIGVEVIEDDGVCPILAAPVGSDATYVTVHGTAGVNHERLVCIDLLGDTSKRVTLMTAPGADPAIIDSVAAAVIGSGRKATAIKDSPGFVGQRMVAMVANLGCYMAEISLASPEDIDTAMQLGLNYPRGSIALAEDLGVEACNLILTRLQQITGEDRYRPCLWLNRRAMLGLSLYTPN
jgi:3-hydroxybutyryl-CoA dehydrogenase